MNEEKEIPYGEQYAWPTIEDYEKTLGYKVNEACRMGWDMARFKNKHMGLFEKPENE